MTDSAGVTFSVIVPATNQPASLDTCLAGITAACGPRDEIVPVRDGDSRSPARVRNVGAARAHGDVLLFVDADVVLHPDALRPLREAFDSDPELVAAFGSYDDEPPPGYASQFRNLLHHHVHHEGEGRVQTFWAGLGAIRREAFLAAGGFNGPRYPRPMLEDVELGLRLSDAGAKITLIPEAQGTHLKAWSVRGMLWADLRNRGIPWTRLLLERREAPATLNLGWSHRITALAIVTSPAVAAFTGNPLALLAGGATVIGLNHRFYTVLWRKGGPRLTVAGIFLHILHHLAAVTAVPLGIAAHLRRYGEVLEEEPITTDPAMMKKQSRRSRRRAARKVKALA